MEKGDTPSANKKVTVHGLPVTIEHPKGTMRLLRNDDGKTVYKKHMFNDYGFFNGTKGRDGDEVDCIVGPIGDKAKEVFIVHMVDKGPDVAQCEDEDKCMVGFPSADAAKAAFETQYAPSFYGGMTALPVELFKKRMQTATLPYHEKKIHALEFKPRSAGMTSLFHAMAISGPRVMARALQIQAAKMECGKCPHCGNKTSSTMPGAETKRCGKCGKTFQAVCHVGDLDVKGNGLKSLAYQAPTPDEYVKKGLTSAVNKLFGVTQMKDGSLARIDDLRAGGPGSGRKPGPTQKFYAPGSRMLLNDQAHVNFPVTVQKWAHQRNQYGDATHALVKSDRGNESVVPHHTLSEPKGVQAGGPGSGRRPGFSNPEAQKMHSALLQHGWKKTGQETIGTMQQHQYEHKDTPRNQVHVNDSKQGQPFWQHTKQDENGKPNGGSFGTKSDTLNKYLGGVHFND